MAILAHARPYGEEAYEALAALVGAAKSGDPFAPVTVVVDGGGLALSVRRRLGARPPGVVNLRCTTWSRTAAELSAPWLTAPAGENRGDSGADAGGARRLATAAAELEAVRAALSEHVAPHLSGSSHHPGTLRALARTYRDLSSVPSGVLDVLAAQSARASEVVAVVRAVRSLLAGCVDRSALLAAAAAEARANGERVAALLGTVVVYLPRRVGPGEGLLAEALGACTAVHVVVGTTGDAAIDEEARGLATRLSSGRTGRTGSSPEPPGEVQWIAPERVTTATWVRSAPSADAEILMALRLLLGRNAAGVPLDRMALLHSGVPPYPRLVRDAVAAAGIPAYGGTDRPLSSTVPGRVLLGALGLGDHDWRRDDVMAWIAAGPLLHDGRHVPQAEWDALSSEAGVVGGLEQWRSRLSAHAASLRADARARRALGEEGQDPVSEEAMMAPSARRLERDAQRCDELREFIDDVAAHLAHPPGAWADWGSWAVRLLGRLLGGRTARAAWPDAEVVAFDTVLGVLGALGSLDWLGGAAPTATDFRSALAAEMDAPAPGTERFGHGLLVGRVEEGVGLDLEVVCVVGMVDGSFPRPPGDDVLLPDREREKGGSEVPLRAAGQSDGRRDYLAVLQGARERVVSYPRHDQRRGRELRPARLLLESLERLEARGRRLSPGDVRPGAPDPVRSDAYEVVSSYAEAVRGEPSGAAATACGGGARPSEPVSGDDWRLWSLARWAASRRLDAHPLARADRALSSALTVRRARRSTRFTRFDGAVGPMAGVVPEMPELPATRRARGAAQSPTRLEAYARCPRQHFFAYVLGATSRAAPETVLQLSPAERGVIIHRVLERLVAAEISLHPPASDVALKVQRADAAAQTGDRAEAARLTEREREVLAIAEEELDAARRRGVTGHTALWELERSRILSDLRQHVRSEAAYRAATRPTPLAVEMGFGPATGSAVQVRTPERRTVWFRGRIDRVDRLPDGSLGVIDYKTGRPRRDAGDDPLVGGSRLQLPIYGLAARELGAEELAARELAARELGARELGAEEQVPRGGSARAAYWYVGAPTPPAWLVVDDALGARLAATLDVLLEGMETGRFPGRPGEPDGRPGAAGRGEHCVYCPFDAICPPDRVRSWERKREDRTLARYRALVGPT